MRIMERAPKEKEEEKEEVNDTRVYYSGMIVFKAANILNDLRGEGRRRRRRFRSLLFKAFMNNAIPSSL